jgi:hypothetical protein
MGEDAKHEEEDEDADDGGDAAAPLFLRPLLSHMRRSMMKALWGWFLSRKLL